MVRGCVFLLALGLCAAIDSAKLAELQAELAAKIPTLNATSTVAEWQARADIVGGFVRLPFHDAFGFGTKPDGCLDQSLADHDGLQSIRLIVDPVCTRYAAFISRADCWVIVGSVAIVAAGGTAIPFRYGRTDCTDESTISDAGLLPSANPSSLNPPVNNAWHHVRDVFGYRARLSIREIVALMGAGSWAHPRPRSRPPFALGFALALAPRPRPSPDHPGGWCARLRACFPLRLTRLPASTLTHSLTGAHSLGRPSSDATQNSGFSPLPWVDGGPNTNDLGGNFLTNRYFSSITTVPWRKSTGALAGQWTAATAGGQTPDRIMLDTDMALAIDQSTCAAPPPGGGGPGGPGNAVSFGGGGAGAVASPTNNGNCIFNDPGGTAGPYAELQRYAANTNNNLWKSDFTKVMQKMTEFSYSTWTFSLTSTTLSEITSTTLCNGKSLDTPPRSSHLPIHTYLHNPLHISH